MRSSPFTIEVPYRDFVSEKTGFVSRVWGEFFRGIRDSINSLGVEKSFKIQNNVSAAENIEGLFFDKERVSAAYVDYLIQRVSVDTGATELIEAGIFIVSYNPTSDDWNFHLVGTSGPDDSGVDLTIDSSGQVQYESSNITGIEVISKITWRARALMAKNSRYSKGGGSL